MVVIDPDSTCTNQEEADAAKDFTSGFFASPNVFDQLDGLDVPPLQHIVVDRRSGTLSIEDLDDEEFEERRQVAIDQLETLITSHPKAAGTLETFREFVNELPRAIQPQDSGLWTNVVSVQAGTEQARTAKSSSRRGWVAVLAAASSLHRGALPKNHSLPRQ